MTDLELSPEEMTRMGEQTLRAVIDHIVALQDAPRSDIEFGPEIVKHLKDVVPFEPNSFENLLDFLVRNVIPYSINTAHPDYLGYIPGGGLYPSAVADFLASATNRYVGVWYAGPTLARLEANVLEWFAKLMDMPPTTRGIFTSGGSLATFSAIVTARKDKLGDEIADGVLYASNQTHHAVMKSAMLAGIPEKNIRLLEVDENFRAIPALFEQAIQEDLAKGLKPFCITANAGTTNTGAVDPLPELAKISRKHNCWYHIDGAYGGFFYFCEEGKARLRGIHLADSLVLDPHKGLFLPYGTGCLLVRNGEKLRKAHMLTADYLQDQYTPPGEWNFAEYSPELSRPFRGLSVWLPLKLYGVRAFQENLAEKLSLTDFLHKKFLESPGFEVLSPPDLSVIAFRYTPKKGDVDQFNQTLMKKINRSKRLFLSSTLLNGKFVIRACILSFRTHQAQIDHAFEVIRSAAVELENELLR